MVETDSVKSTLEKVWKSGLDKLLGFPDPEENDMDNVWSDMHVFNNEWTLVKNRMEWYESPNVPQIYQDHLYIFDKNLELEKPDETYYYQNVDTDEFESDMIMEDDLPSNRGEMRFKIKVRTKYAPSGENNFAMVSYIVDTEIKYDTPKGVKFLPRFLALPLNFIYRWLFMHVIAEEMLERDGEYAIERTRDYYQYLRKYHGEEPTQTKSRQAEFTPIPEDGVFFE